MTKYMGTILISKNITINTLVHVKMGLRKAKESKNQHIFMINTSMRVSLMTTFLMDEEYIKEQLLRLIFMKVASLKEFHSCTQIVSGSYTLL